MYVPRLQRLSRQSGIISAEVVPCFPRSVLLVTSGMLLAPNVGYPAGLYPTQGPTPGYRVTAPFLVHAALKLTVCQ